MSLSTLLESFKGFFSRDFWLGAFMPVAVVASLHIWIASTLFSGVGDFVGGLTGDNAKWLVFVLLALIALGYILDPFSRLFGAWLDGSLMPGQLHDRLRSARRAQWETSVEHYRLAMHDKVRVSARRLELVRLLANQRSKGIALVKDDPANAVVTKVGPAQKAIKDARESAKQQWQRQSDADLTEPLDLNLVNEAAVKLGEALEVNSAESNPDLKRAHDEMLFLMRDADGEASHRFDAIGRRYPTLDLHDWHATRLGDVRRGYEAYTRDAYGVDFEFLWPRIKMALADKGAGSEKGFALQVADAMSRCDFALLLLMLTLTVPLVWLPIILVWNGSSAVFLTIGIIAPLVILGLYELVLQSEIAFGLVMRTAVDRYRLEVLPSLSVALPADLDAERNLWNRLANVDQPDAMVDLRYRHLPGSAG